MQANHDSSHPQTRKHRLERERSRLVQDLARINKLLRRREPSVADADWDFDPRGLGAKA